MAGKPVSVASNAASELPISADPAPSVSTRNTPPGRTAVVDAEAVLHPQADAMLHPQADAMLRPQADAMPHPQADAVLHPQAR